MNTDSETLAVRILAILEQGPSTVKEIWAEMRYVKIKAIGMAIARLIDKGKVVRLWLDKAAPRAGGPQPWVFGLAGIKYPGQTLKSRILVVLHDGNGTYDQIAEELGHSTNGTAAAISDLRREGKVKRLGREPSRHHSGVGPWIYGLGREDKIKVVVPHKPDPARIAGPAYCRNYAGWGVWR